MTAPGTSATSRGTGRAATGASSVVRDVSLPQDATIPSLVERVPGATDERRDEPSTLTQVHHDTATLRLARWGVELRVRLDGPDAGWRLALPPWDGAAEAVDVTMPLVPGGSGDRAPDELVDLVRALVREAPVQPVARVRTRRTTIRLVDEAGATLAAVHDDRIEVERDGSDGQHRRRVRVEALGPSLDAGRVVDRVVHALGEQTSGWEPRSVLGMRAQGAPDVVVPPRPRRHGEAGASLTHALAVGVGAFLRADVAVRLDQPDAVHRLRVAARTLRSTLRTFAPLCDDAWGEELRDRLHVAADALAAVRDTEVLYERLEAHAARLDPADRALVVPALDTLLRPRLLEARSAALDELRSPRYLHLLVDLVDAAQHPRLTGRARRAAGDVLPRLVADDWRDLRRAVRQLRDRRTDPQDPAWHRTRILAKRARYAAQAAAPTLGRRARRWAEEMASLTDLLGELHDGVVAGQLLREAAATPGVGGPTGFALGRLLTVEGTAVHEAATQFLREWPQVRRRLGRHGLS